MRGTSLVTHGCPPGGWGVSTCCGRGPRELPREDHVTLNADEVTCDGRGRVKLRVIRGGREGDG